MMELREKIAREIQRSTLGFPTDRLPLSDSDWATADRILALPEIAFEGQRAVIGRSYAEERRARQRNKATEPASVSDMLPKGQDRETGLGRNEA